MWMCPDLGNEVGVARQSPSTILTLLQDRQRVASTPDRAAASGRGDDLDMVADPCPFAVHSNLTNFRAAVHLNALHARRLLAKCLLPERFASRGHEDDVVRHKAEHRVYVACFGCRHPGIDQVADPLLVVAHRPSSQPSSPISGTKRTPPRLSRFRIPPSRLVTLTNSCSKEGSPIGITSRPPGASWAIKVSGTWLPLAAARIAS